MPSVYARKRKGAGTPKKKGVERSLLASSKITLRGRNQGAMQSRDHEKKLTVCPKRNHTAKDNRVHRNTGLGEAKKQEGKNPNKQRRDVRHGPQNTISSHSLSHWSDRHRVPR